MKLNEIKRLKKYFENCEEVLMAFVFGSQSKDVAIKASDWDIAVYFKPKNKNPLDLFHRKIEWEEQDSEYPEEDKVWGDLIDILQTDNVDLVILNRAAANIATAAIKGQPLVIKNYGLYLEFMLLITKEAEDYYDFVQDYYAISQRSLSLNPQDRERLIKTVDFMEKEMALYSYFSNLSKKVYEDEILKRHEVEKWLENIVVATIDISKIVVGSEKKLIPDTYREAVSKAIQILKLPNEFADNLARWVKLRNVITHEYLDIKWKKISNFIQGSEPYLQKFISATKKYIQIFPSPTVTKK